jgi:hypothetical protein
MWRRPSQLLKSPTTDTRRAFGAQTAKATPFTPSISRRCAPSRSQGRRCVPSASSHTSVSPSTNGKRYGSSSREVCESQSTWNE